MCLGAPAIFWGNFSFLAGSCYHRRCFEAPFLYLDMNAKSNFHINSYEFRRHQN